MRWRWHLIFCRSCRRGRNTSLNEQFRAQGWTVEDLQALAARLTAKPLRFEERTDSGERP